MILFIYHRDFTIFMFLHKDIYNNSSNNKYGEIDVVVLQCLLRYIYIYEEIQITVTITIFLTVYSQ